MGEALLTGSAAAILCILVVLLAAAKSGRYATVDHVKGVSMKSPLFALFFSVAASSTFGLPR
jgi:NADH:ubiquinone oxidoreductase subunit 2 (subunit N)